ncbi:MAG: hypothetical protein NEA02_11275 [Thermoanaerobaculia bacterium]|nr:hypothetical protein [Thermoanaerobaculia bacterium]
MSLFVRRLCIFFAFLLVFGSFALAALGQTTPRPAPAAKEEMKYEPVTEKGFRNRVFEIRHRDPHALQSVLVPLGSGTHGAIVLANRDFKTISVRDFPENIAAIEEALKRLDKPEAPAADVELRLHVLIAGGAAGDALPEELREVVASLKTALAYRTYAPIAAAVDRVKDGTRRFAWSGQTEKIDASSNPTDRRPAMLRWNMSAIAVDRSTAGRTDVRIDGFEFEVSQPGTGTLASLRTDLSIHEGENVVVGTSTLRDRGLILVLSARVVK